MTMDWKSEAIAAQTAAPETPAKKPTLADLAASILGVTVPDGVDVYTADGVIFRLDTNGGLVINIPLADGSFIGGPVATKADAGALLAQAQMRGV